MMFPAFSWGFDMHDILASRKSQSQGKTIFLCSINVTLKFLSSVTFQEHLQCAWPAPCNVPTLVLTNLNSSCLWVCLLSPSGLHCFCLLSFSAGVSFAPPPRGYEDIFPLLQLRELCITDLQKDRYQSCFWMPYSAHGSFLWHRKS